MIRISNKVKGFYVYCIRPKPANIFTVKVKGVEFAKSIKVFPFKDIEVVIGETDPSKFDPELIKEKLLSDTKWAEENIRCHHEAVVQVFQSSVVIPMKFGMMYKTKQGLIEMLAQYYPNFKNLIVRLRDKKEWGVKAYFDHKKFIEVLKNKNRQIQKLEKRQSAVTEGMRWYTERKIDEIIAQELEEEIAKERQRLVGKLEKYSDEMRLNDALAKDMILNAACLVKNNLWSSFQDLFHGLIKNTAQQGIKLEITGPWPPYNFVELNHEKA